jgi:hypothetical protein
MAASRKTKVYSAAAHTLSFAGRQIDGFADGAFCTVKMMSPAYTSKVGANGEVVRIATNDFRAAISVFLLPTSESNDVLKGILATDLADENGAGVGTFELRDRSSGVLVAKSNDAWIAGLPDVERSKEVGQHEWKLECGHMDLDPSGAPQVQTSQ